MHEMKRNVFFSFDVSMTIISLLKTNFPLEFLRSFVQCKRPVILKGNFPNYFVNLKISSEKGGVVISEFQI